MKHFTQANANGLCTPPCGSSHGKSTRFFFLTLLLGLLTLGSTLAWGRTPTIFGEGLPGLNASGASNWDSNTKVMQSMGEDGYWYAEFLNVPATDNNKYRFKIAINDGNWWDGAMVGISTNDANNFGNLDRSKSNVLFVSGGGSNENRISFKMPFDGDVYVFYKASEAKVWVVAVPQNVAAAPNNSGTRKLKTDIILKDGSNDWSSDGIKFEKNDAVSTYKHVTSYILPTRKSTETSAAIRFEMCYGSTPDVYISGKSDGRPAALSSLTPRRIIYLWDGNNHNNNTDNNNVGWISYTLPTYPMRKSGWKLFVKDYNSGNPTTMDANGSATLTLNGGSSYEFFIANTDYATNLSTYSQSAAATYPAVHSVNWFGGCYIDQSNSSNVTFNDIQVYKSDKLGTLTHPVVDSHHLQGKFQVSGSGSKDVTFTFDGGKITINAVDHVEAFSGDFYVYGAGSNAQNWVTGWSSTDQGGGKANPANHMTITNNVARKTYYGVKGDNLEFKVSNGTNDVGTWSNYSASKQSGVSAAANNQNIRFSLSNASDVTVCYDGTNVWLEVKERQKPNDAWRVTGSFNSWNMYNEQMSDDATNRCKTVTINNISKEYDKNNHGWIRFKLFAGTAWDNAITANNATVIGLEGTVIGTVSDDKDGDEGRIIVQVDETSDITFSYYQYAGGANIVTVKRTTPTPAEPDYQPWSGDSNRDWYLTGDFTNPNVFDGWTMNPSGYKFAANGDNYQTISITLDPNDASIFHNQDGHKLTRFEIIRQGTWDNPRINKPQFDAESSNCELKTDWKDAGSNRMSLELTVKSVIKFDIWRWGTAPGSANRKVTVTITPVPQVTVTFMANGETFATQTFDKGGKASIPVGIPARSGHNFNGWDWDFNTTVNENTTIDATWVYKAISSVVLNESTHMTWVGNSDFALTPTLTPSDAIAKSVAWSSNATGVATVSDGIVHAVAAGEARITCTVTDQFDQQVSAYCNVTVAACEMATENLYSMTVTGYNSKIGDNADLSGLWNESSDNGVMTQTARLVRIAFKDLATEYMTEDANGKVAGRASITDDSDKWMYYSAGTGFFYLQNYNTGHFLYKDKSTGLMGQNGEWKFYGTKAASYADADTYRWLENGSGDQLRICNKDGYNGGLNGSHTLMRYYVDAVDGWNTPYVRCGLGGHQGNNPIRAIITQVEASVDNPFFVSSLMNGSYYRMNTNATVQANLGGALVPGAVITVRLYADAATTVKLQKTDGTEIETINLSADAEREYTYTGSALVGEEAFVIKATDNHAGIASIVVTRTYAIRLAQLIEETEIGGTLTLTCDYATDNAVINKAITINGNNHAIGNLTVKTEGDLTLSGALTVNDFSIYAKAGNTTTPAASGQVRNATNLTVNGEAYFLYTVDPSGQVHYGWYDFTVPFLVNTASGIKGIDANGMKEDFAYGTDYAILEHQGDKQAAGEYSFKKFQGIMEPCRLYSITLDDEFNYSTLRFQKTTEGALVASDEVTLNAYSSSETTKANWNGVGNGTLHHADAGSLSVGYVQVYKNGENSYMAVNKNDYSFAVGSAFMVQQEGGTMTLNQASHGELRAPARQTSNQHSAICVQIAREGKPFSDQLFISSNEAAEQHYTLGVDVAKAGNIGNVSVPQIWTTAYNTKLCVHEAPINNGQARFDLSLYAPADGSYTLISSRIPEDKTLYLTYNGKAIWNLSVGETYTLDLNQGTTTEYGLLLVEGYRIPTGIENVEMNGMTGAQKIMHNGILYILHNGKTYNAQGAITK